MMTVFKALFCFNIKRRLRDGFAIGYNVFFPLLMIWLLGLLCKGIFKDEIVTGYQYYGVVMIPFCILLSIITAAYAGKDDAYACTADRILIAPISNIVIVCTKVLAELIVFSGCSFFILGISTLLWHICRLQDLGHILVLYLSISYVTASVGTFIGLGMKDFLKLKNILNIPILISAILGGCFYQFGTLNRTLQIVLELSPLRWINRSIFLLIYDDKKFLLYMVSAILIIIGVIFMSLAVICFKREEYGNGELLGYEK